MKRFALLMLTATLASSPVSAQILLTDNFNAENGGATALNYNAFANWTVTGQVDLVKSGYGGVVCAGGSGVCVDLDGSPGPGKLVSKTAFSFLSGEIFRISFDISGNQRSGPPDEFALGLDFGAGGANIGPIVGTGGFSIFTEPGPGLRQKINNLKMLGPSDIFSTWSLQFLAQSAGSVTYSLGTTSDDGNGPILDNVVVQRVVTSTVPEPSTWAMFAFGLGGLGIAARRRVRKV